MSNMKLYIVHVGYYDHSIGIDELHSNILVVAGNATDAKNKVKSKEIFQNKQMHIDGICEITNVDGYEIQLAPTVAQPMNKQFGYTEVKQMN